MMDNISDIEDLKKMNLEGLDTPLGMSYTCDRCKSVVVLLSTHIVPLACRKCKTQTMRTAIQEEFDEWLEERMFF